jgi:hypothetical protein
VVDKSLDIHIERKRIALRGKKKKNENKESNERIRSPEFAPEVHITSLSVHLTLFGMAWDHYLLSPLGEKRVN